MTNPQIPNGRRRVVKNWKSPEFFTMPAGAFVPNTFGREFKSFEEAAFRDDAFAQFGFTELFVEPTFKNFVGHHYLDGAFTHEHMDDAPSGFMHVRANWMLQKPPIGGNPVLDGVTIEVNPGDLWVCFASEEQHASAPIKGGERFICSFGALVNRPKNFSLQNYFNDSPRVIGHNSLGGASR